MLFNSTIYIFAFLPVVFVGYFLLQKLAPPLVGKLWLVAASLYFYGYWNPKYLLLILASIAVNYAIGRGLHRARLLAADQPRSQRALLTVGVLFNLGLLGWFKYADFLIGNVNLALGSEVPLLHLVLPLAISFFTFQQIAYLVDCYRFDTQEYDFVSYCLFVCFFPQLIAGPIVHHREMMPQFVSRANTHVHWQNIGSGVLIFCIGLFKKVVIADTFALWANQGYADAGNLDLLEAWATSLSYTFQLYYDFSGYTDMAIGAALLFNIRLPLNFNSPYKATSIQDFWRRWHMTLSRWLRDYVYIALGGNRGTSFRLYFNLMATFVLGGLWHGAGWTFVVWGTLHGVALCLHRLWRQLGLRMPALAGWLLTFVFVHITWVFFRAEDVPTALAVLRGMAGMNGSGVVQALPWQALAALDADTLWALYDDWGILGGHGNLIFVALFALLAFTARNSNAIALNGHGFRLWHPVLATSALFAAIVLSIGSSAPEFLYFNF